MLSCLIAFAHKNGNRSLAFGTLYMSVWESHLNVPDMKAINPELTALSGKIA